MYNHDVEKHFVFSRLLWLVHRYVFYGMGLAVVLWGTHRLYITAFIVILVLITLSICVLISRIAMDDCETERVLTPQNEGEDLSSSMSKDSELSESPTEEELLSSSSEKEVKENGAEGVRARVTNNSSKVK